MIFSILLLVVSLNLDSLGVGFIYGMRKLHISNLCKIVICLSSIVYSSISILIGSSLSNHVSNEFGKILGIMILMTIGVCSIIKASKESPSSNNACKKNLTLIESLFISFALSIDSIGAGIGFSLMGLNCFAIPFLIGLGQLLFLELGLLLGLKAIHFEKFVNTKVISIVPGILLILLALLRL